MAFVLLLGMVSPHSPPFSKTIVESTSDAPWIVTHIGQGGMVDGWWQSATGKIAAPPTLRRESGVKKCGYLSGKYGTYFLYFLHAYILLKPLYIHSETHTNRISAKCAAKMSKRT